MARTSGGPSGGKRRIARWLEVLLWIAGAVVLTLAYYLLNASWPTGR